MRKVFIDGGANRGQSTASFLKEWPNSEEFEIFMFEPNTGSPTVSGKKTTLLRKAIWIYDGVIEFFEKAAQSEADVVFLDLEDSVSINQKSSARNYNLWLTLSQ